MSYVAQYPTLLAGNTVITNLVVSGTTSFSNAISNVTATGNVVANYFVGNGYYLTGVSGGGGSSYTNNNVIALLESGNMTSVIDTSGTIYGGRLDIAVRANVGGNITITSNTGYFVGNGYYLTGIGGAGAYSNSNVASYLPNYTGNLQSLLGNVVTTANIQAGYFLGNGAFLTGLYSNANAANYLATYTGNLTANNITTSGFLAVTGNITTASNISTPANIIGANIVGDFIYGNGVYLTGITGGGGTGNYSNANVFFYMPTYNGNLVGLVGNITTVNGNLDVTASNTAGLGGFLLGNIIGNTARFTSNIGAALGVTGNTSITGNIAAAGAVFSGLGNGNVTANYVFANIAQATGFDSLTSNIITTANISASYFIGGNANISGNILAGGNIATTANLVVTNNAYFALNTFTSGYANVSGNLTSQANLNAQGATLTSNLVVGNATIVANVAAGNILSDNLLYANGRQWNFGNALSVVYFEGTTTTTASICTNTDINSVIPPSRVPKNGDIFVDTSTRVNNTQPVYIYVGGNWRQFLTAWGGV